MKNMNSGDIEILKIMLLKLMSACLEDDSDNCTLTMSNERYDIVANITFAIRGKESEEDE